MVRMAFEDRSLVRCLFLFAFQICRMFGYNRVKKKGIGVIIVMIMRKRIVVSNDAVLITLSILVCRSFSDNSIIPTSFIVTP